MRLFEIYKSGDPYSHRWDVSEFLSSYDEPTATYRGDLSGLLGRTALRYKLRRLYPHCKIKELP